MLDRDDLTKDVHILTAEAVVPALASKMAMDIDGRVARAVRNLGDNQTVLTGEIPGELKADWSIANEVIRGFFGSDEDIEATGIGNVRKMKDTLENKQFTAALLRMARKVAPSPEDPNPLSTVAERSDRFLEATDRLTKHGEVNDPDYSTARLIPFLNLVGRSEAEKNQE